MDDIYSIKQANNVCYQSSTQSTECQLCMNKFSQSNHPIKICINDHDLCQKCVQQNLFIQKIVSYHQTKKTVYLCPFCQELIDYSMFVTNYKLLELIKNNQQESTAPTQKQSSIKLHQSLFQKLSEQNYRIIMSFIHQKQKINLSSSNLFLRSLLMDGKLWGEFQISDCLSMDIHSNDYQRNWNLRLKWIQKYFSVIKPFQVKVLMRDFCDDDTLVTFFLKEYKWVHKLTLYCQSMQLHLAIAKSCTQITFLNVSSNIFCDQLFQQMAKGMKKIKHFQVIKDDVNFTGKNLSKYFPQGLQSILMKPHMIEFQEIALLVKNNPDNLIDIELDIEECSQQVLVDILESLTSVQVLKLYHLENIYIPDKLAQVLSSKVRQLYLTKAYQMPVQMIIQKIATPKLLTLDFTEINMLSDKNIKLITQRCPYLKRLNVSWCNMIGQASLSQLINNCLNLQYINFTGLKVLTDNVFIQYAQLVKFFNEEKYDFIKHLITKSRHEKQKVQEISFQTQQFIKDQFFKQSFTQNVNKITTLRMAKQVNCISCNGISDAVLKLIYLINRKVNTINYYSNSMGLYAHDQLDQ